MSKHRKIQAGDIFKNLEVLENLGYRDYYDQRASYYKCKCLKCGSVKDYPAVAIDKVDDCGCGRHDPRRPIDPGTEFGRLKVVEIAELVPKRGYYYLCECSCQKHTRLLVRGNFLHSGETRSCGCIHDELFLKKSAEGKKTIFVKSTLPGRIAKSNFKQKNNTSGYTGVSWHKARNKWQSRISFQKKQYCLGYYDSPELAAEAYQIAKKQLHGSFLEWYAQAYPDKWSKIQNKNRGG